MHQTVVKKITNRHCPSDEDYNDANVCLETIYPETIIWNFLHENPKESKLKYLGKTRVDITGKYSKHGYAGKKMLFCFSVYFQIRNYLKIVNSLNQTKFRLLGLCVGDSGGPVWVEDYGILDPRRLLSKERYEIIAVVSAGEVSDDKACGHQEETVTKLILPIWRWIKDQLKTF